MISRLNAVGGAVASGNAQPMMFVLEVRKIRSLMRAGILVICAVTFCGVARADTAKARELYQKATRAYNLQQFEQALQLFQDAYEQKDAPAILFDIGQCQRQLGQYEAAARSYRAYLAQAPSSPIREQVEARIADMDRAAHEQRALKPPTGTESPTETKQLTETKQPIETKPPTGTKQPTETKPLTETKIGVAAKIEQPGAHTLRLAGIGTGASGLALIVLGGIFAGLSKSAGDIAYHSPIYDPAADDRQKSYRTADIVCFTFGGAALVVGVTLTLLGARR
jgi:tetratricopeptide (TPR) repeat protein